MKKRIGMGVMFLLVSASLLAIPVPAEVGITSQCWDFGEEPIGDYLVLPTEDTLNNEFGDPIGMINDMSGDGVNWNQEGYLFGSEFKIVLDIPNQPIANPYKELTINMTYQGDISFLWVSDIDSGELFTAVSDAVITPIENDWYTYQQTFRFEPNPREELVVIGLKGIEEVTGQITPAAVDQICITTHCVPEPATMALLALGSVCVMRRKRD